MPEAAQTISLASHVSVAVAFVLLFGVARSIPPTSTARRWSLAAIAAGGIQLVMLLFWAAGFATELRSFSGFASVATAILIGWPLLLPKPNSRWDLLLSTVMVALALALASIAAVEILTAASIPLGIWGVLGLMACLSALIGLAQVRPSSWPLFLAGFGLVFTGFAIETWYATGVLQLLEAIVYPLMIGMIIKGLVERAIRAESATPLAGFSQAIQYFETALEPELLIFNGLRLITLSLQARYGLYIRGPDSTGALILRNAVDSRGDHEPSGPPLQGRAMPELVAAMAQDHAQVFRSERELKELCDALSLAPVGQALVASFSPAGEETGILILLAHSDRPHWSQSELETFEASVSLLGNRIQTGPDSDLEKQAAEIEILRGELHLVLQELSEVGAVETRRSLTQVGTLTSSLTSMRDPISSIRGYSELLSSSVGELADAGRLKLVEHIRENAESLDHQLTDLLDLMTAPQVIAASEVEIGEVVDIAASQVGSDLKRFNMQLKREISSNLPTVRLDPDHLRQITVLLLERAIRVSPDGSQIHVVANAEDETWVSVAVSDQGPGVPAEDLGRAFQGPEGTLPQVKALTDSLGGRVWIGSEIGSGSTVTVMIPANEGAAASSS